jgi:TPP-dependent pyruvate/acetoin dehydrogenase alpha subunit
MIEKKIKSEVIKAFKYAEKSKFPAASEAFKGVYAK